jgi:predicted DNA-binding transcriptional regulator AlpA
VTAKTSLPPVPAVLADVAMIDGPTGAAAGGISLSSWHELVRLKEAPQPLIRRPRCTRWRVADVRTWLIERAANADEGCAASLTVKAKRASDAAKSKRISAAVA